MKAEALWNMSYFEWNQIPELSIKYHVKFIHKQDIAADQSKNVKGIQCDWFIKPKTLKHSKLFIIYNTWKWEGSYLYYYIFISCGTVLQNG